MEEFGGAGPVQGPEAGVVGQAGWFEGELAGEHVEHPLAPDYADAADLVQGDR